jgi:aspartyl/glutamyl-tRNA(Asn/Gln) amidotransferase C subunit
MRKPVIAVSAEEKESLRKSMDSILNYVEQVQKVSKDLGSERKAGLLRNVMREDNNPHESGIFTEVLLSAAPKRDGQYLKVKKIL